MGPMRWYYPDDGDLAVGVLELDGSLELLALEDDDGLLWVWRTAVGPMLALACACQLPPLLPWPFVLSERWPRKLRRYPLLQTVVEGPLCGVFRFRLLRFREHRWIDKESLRG